MTKRGEARKWKRIEANEARIEARCPDCPKLGYSTRSQARRAAKRKHPDAAMSVYRCSSGFWHIGHLPARVKLGDKTRDEYFGGKS